MTTENEQQTTQASVPTIEELQQQISHLTEIKSTAFTERDSWKQKAHEASDKLSQIQTEFEALKTTASTTSADTEAKLTKLQQRLIDSAIKAKLQEHGATNPQTAAKLMDRSLVTFDSELNIVEDAILSQIEALKESDPILFTPVQTKQTPIPVKRVATPENGGSIEERIRAAKSQQEILAILASRG